MLGIAVPMPSEKIIGRHGVYVTTPKDNVLADLLYRPSIEELKEVESADGKVLTVCLQ